MGYHAMFVDTPVPVFSGYVSVIYNLRSSIWLYTCNKNNAKNYTEWFWHVQFPHLVSSMPIQTYNHQIVIVYTFLDEYILDYPYSHVHEKQ